MEHVDICTQRSMVRVEVGEISQELVHIQCEAECMDSESGCLHLNLGFGPHFSVIWGKNLTFW